MEPSGVHLINRRSRRACGYLYATGDTRVYRYGTLTIYRCDGCGDLFDNADFVDPSLIRAIDDTADINLADVSED